MRASGGQPRWLRVQQAADTLGVSASTVRRWADAGRLVGQRTPSGQRRFAVAELEAIAAGRRQDGGVGRDDGGRRSEAERRYHVLLDTSLELASTLDLSEVLQSAARRMSAAFELPDCDIYRLEGDDRLVCVAACLGGSFDDDWTGREVALRDWACDRLAVEARRAITVSDLDDPRLSEAEREAMRRYDQCSFITVPLIANDQVIGLVDLLDHVPRRFTDADVELAEAVAKLVAMALDHARLYQEVKDLHLGNLRALSSALSAKDYYTLGHASRVAAYAAMLGFELGWGQERLEQVENVAFCHDIGKIGVSDRVLLKAGPLTSEEWELIRQHPGISAEIVRPLFDDDLVAGVRHHHERFDGCGYPDGLAGPAIPEVARALGVVDAYDAMSCERPYRRALSYRQCIAELRRCAGNQLDPDMVTAFLAALRRLQRRRSNVAALARQAAQLVDPASHTRLCTQADEGRPEYRAMVARLRGFRDQHPQVRFVTSFAMVGDQCISVLDSGETEEEISHCGDPWLPEDDLARVLAGVDLAANVLTADDFGVWVSSAAPVHDAQGRIVAAVTVDVPAVELPGQRLPIERSHTLAAMLQSAAIRFSRAEVEAITDGLTGLYNHRYLHERLEEELERSRRQGTSLSLLFIDCDEFKAYNDAHGHKAGDAALTRIARIIETCSRRMDLAARYGGEEFVLALVDTDAVGAMKVAERIRSEVERSSGGDRRRLSVSVGLAVYPDDASAKDELLDKADWAMYAAKRAGRNGVLAFGDGLVGEDTWLSRRGR